MSEFLKSVHTNTVRIQRQNQEMMIGVIQKDNMDGSYDVTIKGNTGNMMHVPYLSNENLTTGDTVLINFLDGDRQRPVIVMPGNQLITPSPLVFDLATISGNWNTRMSGDLSLAGGVATLINNALGTYYGCDVATGSTPSLTSPAYTLNLTSDSASFIGSIVGNKIYHGQFTHTSSTFTNCTIYQSTLNVSASSSSPNWQATIFGFIAILWTDSTGIYVLHSDASGQFHYYVAHYDANGNKIYDTLFFSTSGHLNFKAALLDSSGNLLVYVPQAVFVINSSGVSTEFTNGYSFASFSGCGYNGDSIYHFVGHNKAGGLFVIDMITVKATGITVTPSVYSSSSSPSGHTWTSMPVQPHHYGENQSNSGLFISKVTDSGSNIYYIVFNITNRMLGGAPAYISTSVPSGWSSPIDGNNYFFFGKDFMVQSQTANSIFVVINSSDLSVRWTQTPTGVSVPGVVFSNSSIISFGGTKIYNVATGALVGTLADSAQFMVNSSGTGLIFTQTASNLLIYK